MVTTYKEIPAPARKADYPHKLLVLKEDPPAESRYMPAKYPGRKGMVVTIERRMNAAETQASSMDVSRWGAIRVLRVRWTCPTCESGHTGFIPETWITEGKAVFVEKEAI